MYRNFFNGDKTDIGATAAALGAAHGAMVYELVVQADPANAGNVLLGSSALQNIVLVPGASITLPMADPSMIYVKTASGTQTVHYMGRE